jgi:Xaa-Pro aminopeptidase
METDTLLDFPAELFARRRSRVLHHLGEDAMVLPAAPPLIRGGDSELPYRPDSDLFYLTGCREPEAVLVLRGHGDRERSVLFVRPRDPTMEVWTGPRLGPRGAQDLLRVDGVRSIATLEEELPELLRGAPRVHFRLGLSPAVEKGVMEALRWSRTRGSRTGSGPRGVVDPGGILHELRLRKEPEEVAAMRQAVAASVQGFQEAFRVLGPGVGEWEVEAALVAGFRRGGATGPAFAPIVASGPNGCVLHYVDNQRRIRGPELVLMDAGAEVRLYAADISRTVPASGRFTPAQRDVYQCVEAARAAGVAAVAPGVPVDRVHRAALECLVKGLVELGVLEGDVEELLEAEAHRPFYPHQTSHWLGLDTHDPGDYAISGSPRVLEPGMVLTVEPGLYFPPVGFLGETEALAGAEGVPLAGSASAGSGTPAPGPRSGAPSGQRPRQGSGTGDPGPDLAAAYRGMGIRIEDDILVTEEGCEVLTAALPTDPDELEALLKG